MAVTIIDTLAPKNDADFATHSAEYALGGWREVADNTARDAIPTERRTEGMHVYVIGTDTTYRLDAGLTNGDWIEISGVSGAITGDYPIINNPTTAEELAANLDATYQETWPSEVSAYTIYVETTGNDTTGDGSFGSPYLTLQRAMQDVARLNGSGTRATIRLGSGSFNCPPAMEANYVDIVGSTSADTTLTIDTVVVASNEAGIVIDVTGVSVLADELVGSAILWTSGTSNGNTGWIYKNDATAALVTRIYATQDSGVSSGIESMAAADTLDIISLDTTLNFTNSPVFKNSVQFNISSCNFDASGSSTLFFLNTDKVEISRCYWGSSINRGHAGGFGRVFVTSCYYACGGTGLGTSACIALVTNNGYFQFGRGTVIDASNAITARRRVVVENVGILVFNKHIVCKGFSGAAEIFNISGSSSITTDGVGFDDNILIEDGNGGIAYQTGPVFEFNNTALGPGGWYKVPSLRGAITGDYSVIARNGANVVVGYGASTITTALGTNTVSADGGSTLSAQAPDLTTIKNGFPDAIGFADAKDPTPIQILGPPSTVQTVSDSGITGGLSTGTASTDYILKNVHIGIVKRRGDTEVSSAATSLRDTIHCIWDMQVDGVDLIDGYVSETFFSSIDTTPTPTFNTLIKSGDDVSFNTATIVTYTFGPNQTGYMQHPVFPTATVVPGPIAYGKQETLLGLNLPLAIASGESRATDTFTVNVSSLTAGDKIEFDMYRGGIFELVGVSGARTSGQNDFDVTGGSVTILADEIVAALNDDQNNFADWFTAVHAGGGVINLTSYLAGTLQNNMSFTTTLAAPVDISPATSNFAGGANPVCTLTFRAASSDMILKNLCIQNLDPFNGLFQISSIQINGGSNLLTDGSINGGLVDSTVFTLLGGFLKTPDLNIEIASSDVVTVTVIDVMDVSGAGNTAIFQAAWLAERI